MKHQFPITLLQLYTMYHTSGYIIAHTWVEMNTCNQWAQIKDIIRIAVDIISSHTLLQQPPPMTYMYVN